jgi:hypothetical protein
MHQILFKPDSWILVHEFNKDYSQDRELKIDGLGRLSNGLFFSKYKEYECSLSIYESSSNSMQGRVRILTTNSENRQCYKPGISLFANMEIFNQMLAYLKLKSSDEIRNFLTIFHVDDESITDECWLSLNFKGVEIDKLTVSLGNFKSSFDTAND